jgi:hypothetical protein
MKKPLGQIRRIVLKGNRKEHLAECDESGTLLTATLCGKQYNAASRTANKPYQDGQSLNVCTQCVHQLGMRRYGSLRSRLSDADNLKTHLGFGIKPRCGQDCAGDNRTENIAEVTCQKCRVWFREQENSK